MAMIPLSKILVSLLVAVLVGAAGVTLAACQADATAESTGSSNSSTTAASGPNSDLETTAGTVSSTTSTTGGQSPAGAEDLFDDSTIHEISVSFAQEDYEEMIETYRSSGAKDWIEATVIIDGVTYQDVGMRLKGNSSIRGLRDGRTGGPGGNVSATNPEGLPWLIRLDKNVDGQNHGGITEIAIRSNNSATSLNEAVSLELLQMAGLASQKATAVRFAVNGSDSVLRLGTENPDDVWMAEHLSDTGALYKAESTGDYSYRGPDPDSYDEVFDQEGGKDNADLTPLIEFLDFVNNADDATFVSTLADRIDLESFATYLAMEELIANFDDIDGPGNNSYLYYDPATDRFTIVPWDHNLAFGVMNNRIGGGGNVPGGGGNVPGGGGNAPGGAGQPGGPRGKANALVERFHANSEFEALYQERLAELRAQLYESGAAAEVLAKWVALLKTQASDLVEPAIVDQEAAKIETYF